MYQKHAIVICILLFLFPLLVWGSTTGKISGMIKDAENGEPLPGANILIEGTMMGASSTLDGDFYIINIPPGIYNVRATMMGYQTVVQKEVLVKVGLTTELNFELSQTVLDLGDVVEVIAERPIVQKDLTSGRSIVTSEDIKEMPVESFRGVLQTKAGVTTGSTGAMHIRGGRSSEISYMIDGIAISNPFYGGLAVEVENTAIQELQVVSGTFNAEYGQAMSGVVNIVTKEGGKDFHGNLSFYMGDRLSNHEDIFLNIKKFEPLTQHNIDASLHGPIPYTNNRVSFFASARYYNDDGYIYGKREHNPGDAIYVDESSAYVLALSPYNTDPFWDDNHNGVCDGEYFFDQNFNFVWDEGEPFEDLNQNEAFDGGEAFFLDFNGNGKWDQGRINFYEPLWDESIWPGDFTVGEPFTDSNDNGEYDTWESFEDLDGNGEYSRFSDLNFNGKWDSGFSGDGKLVSMNPYRKFSGQGKLTFKITPNLTFRYSILYDKIRNKFYDVDMHLFRYNPDGQPTKYRWTLSNKFDVTHQLSSSTFYELKYAHYEYDFKQYLYEDWQDSRYLPNELLSATPGNEFYGGGQNKYHYYRNSVTNVLRFDLTNQFNKTHQFKLGVEAKHHKMFFHQLWIDIRDTYNWKPTIHTPETSTNNDKYTRYPKEFSCYLQDKIELKDMIVNLGLRYDYFNSSWKVVADNRDRLLISGKRESLDELKLKDASAKHYFSPRLGIAYPITDRGTIHFSYGHFFQIPPFAYLYANPEFEVISGRFKSYLGNANLNAQKTVIYEIGLQQQLSDDIGIEAIAFYKDIIDWLGTEIHELYTRGDYYNRYATLDFGNVRGFTLSFEKRRSGYLSASVDYTYSVAEGNSSSPLSKYYDLQTVPPRESEKRVIPLDWDQTHTLNLNVTVSQPKNWGIGLLGKLGTGYPYTPTNADIRTDAENSERKPSRMTFDLHAHKDFYFDKNINVVLYLKIYNLFDRLNELKVYNDTGRATYALYPSVDHGDEYGRHNLNDYLNRPDYYSGPRSVRFGLSMGF